MALRTAESSKCRQKHGAIVVRGGSVLAKASNIDKNHPDCIEPSKVRMHASMCAERRALAKISNPKGCTIFVARLTKTNIAGYSRPCERCYKACEAAGVASIIYT